MESKELDKIFYSELRGKTVTTDQVHILKWAEDRLKPAILAWHTAELAKARYNSSLTCAKYFGKEKEWKELVDGVNKLMEARK